uniref:Uncharacterized protein n=1 Tax=Chromera velia CCMP2878 TaxID=1169474 RepID=A0A0G4I501_9ALVE|eukprot:Cvel_1817.t1-p1 / transcript=Cvel_1817.t1 / gene=Cvel_1817 / organism=Chromera_velia_CCMP2878 / gene_product=hypothetical protein / transcript_product=hypothetical protein / location=Cvel_scaffold67:40998-44417(-) / protein_length=831 / sequence_SO=supercontig / SO=protein_coding / is_pseudo=false
MWKIGLGLTLVLLTGGGLSSQLWPSVEEAEQLLSSLSSFLPSSDSESGARQEDESQRQSPEFVQETEEKATAADRENEQASEQRREGETEAVERDEEKGAQQDQKNEVPTPGGLNQQDSPESNESKSPKPDSEEGEEEEESDDGGTEEGLKGAEGDEEEEKEEEKANEEAAEKAGENPKRLANPLEGLKLGSRVSNKLLKTRFKAKAETIESNQPTMPSWRKKLGKKITRNECLDPETKRYDEHPACALPPFVEVESFDIWEPHPLAAIIDSSITLAKHKRRNMPRGKALCCEERGAAFGVLYSAIVRKDTNLVKEAAQEIGDEFHLSPLSPSLWFSDAWFEKRTAELEQRYWMGQSNAVILGEKGKTKEKSSASPPSEGEETNRRHLIPLPFVPLDIFSLLLLRGDPTFARDFLREIHEGLKNMGNKWARLRVKGGRSMTWGTAKNQLKENEYGYPKVRHPLWPRVLATVGCANGEYALDGWRKPFEDPSLCDPWNRLRKVSPGEIHGLVSLVRDFVDLSPPPENEQDGRWGVASIYDMRYKLSEEEKRKLNFSKYKYRYDQRKGDILPSDLPALAIILQSPYPKVLIDEAEKIRKDFGGPAKRVLVEEKFGLFTLAAKFGPLSLLKELRGEMDAEGEDLLKPEYIDNTDVSGVSVEEGKNPQREYSISWLFQSALCHSANDGSSVLFLSERLRYQDAELFFPRGNPHEISTERSFSWDGLQPEEVTFKSPSDEYLERVFYLFDTPWFEELDPNLPLPNMFFIGAAQTKVEDLLENIGVHSNEFKDVKIQPPRLADCIVDIQHFETLTGTVAAKILTRFIQGQLRARQWN